MLENLVFSAVGGHLSGHFGGHFSGHFANHINILYRKSLPTTIYCGWKAMAGETRLSRKAKIF